MDKRADYHKKYYEANKEKYSNYYKEKYIKRKSIIDKNKENEVIEDLDESIKRNRRYIKNLIWIFENKQQSMIDYYRITNVYLHYFPINENFGFIDEFDVETQVIIMIKKLKKLIRESS